MTKLTKESVFSDAPARPETKLDKTTRIVREITEDEAKKRQIKMARLRSARLEKEVKTPDQAASPTGKSRKSASKKAATKP